MKKPPATQPVVAIEKENIKPTIQQPYWLLKSNTCKKLGAKAVGGISYQLLGDIERQILSVRITANFGGGYFSREIVPFSAVKACLDRRAEDKPFASKLFKEAFIGRSSNNAGFMAALLRAENLISLAPDTETQHVTSGDWTAFVKTMLVVPGEKIEIEMPMPVNVQPETPPEAANVPAQAKTTKTHPPKRPKAESPADNPPDETGE
jgi:hypothetical protein